MEMLRMAVAGLHREIDSIKRELDYRGGVIQGDREALSQLASRQRLLELHASSLLSRIEHLEQSNCFSRSAKTRRRDAIRTILIMVQPILPVVVFLIALWLGAPLEVASRLAGSN